MERRKFQSLCRYYVYVDIAAIGGLDRPRFKVDWD